MESNVLEAPDLGSVILREGEEVYIQLDMVARKLFFIANRLNNSLLAISE